jgi:hypothetical protein
MPRAAVAGGDDHSVTSLSDPGGTSSGQIARQGTGQQPSPSNRDIADARAAMPGSGIHNDNGQPKITPNPPVTPVIASDSSMTMVPSAPAKPSTKRIPGHWEFMVVASPDLSTVETYPSAQTGFLVGLTAGYHISRRWTVSTGLLYTVKHYDAPGEAYHLPPGYWTNNPYLKMKSVSATCNMWDIPLNIRYDLYAGKKQKIFVNTGLSSYLMKKEDLHYFYTYNNNPYDRAYVYNKNSNYWLAIGNISAGFEQQLGSGLSLQAEPFAKFSLGDVGYGKIRLNSYGLFVGLKYRPFTRTHPHH